MRRMHNSVKTQAVNEYTIVTCSHKMQNTDKAIKLNNKSYTRTEHNKE